MAVTVDLSTLSGWSSVTTGQHTLTIKAKAQGYRDSNPSVGVNFTRAPQGNTLTITWSERNYDGGAEAAYAKLILNRVPQDADDYDYILDVPYAGAYGELRSKADPYTAIATFGYGGDEYTQVIDNVTSYTLWREWDQWGEGTMYIGINNTLLPVFANKQTINISAPTSITVQFDYDE